ncbi:hypothetical protein LV716_00235 [Flagellimonas sp. HMM57]|uniref:hypothetical protein n=1 Tax=unclassified Flagellimonas TaxID=2644544 RepID=UPI0013D30C6C|nr:MULTISPECIES: hypothetical protein [unclassified Flagellimonas]UII76262.1 hypothetical protein LV716_00235 [Flagellimonas sp. HMM57]
MRTYLLFFLVLPGLFFQESNAQLGFCSGNYCDAIFRLEADTDNNNESENPLIQLRQDGGLFGGEHEASREEMML